MTAQLGEDDDGQPYPPPVYDRDGLYVMAEQCKTCIFRPGNLMDLRDGRLADLTATTDRLDTNIVCHQTLGDPVGAFCKGSVDRRPGQIYRIAQRMRQARPRWLHRPPGTPIPHWKRERGRYFGTVDGAATCQHRHRHARLALACARGRIREGGTE